MEKLIGYIQKIENNEAFCIMQKEKSQNAVKFELTVPLSAFKKEVQVGIIVKCSVKNGIISNIRKARAKKWTVEDEQAAIEFAKKMNKKIKWI